MNHHYYHHQFHHRVPICLHSQAQLRLQFIFAQWTVDRTLQTLYYKHVTAKSIGDFELFKSGQFIAKNVFKLTSIFRPGWMWRLNKELLGWDINNMCQKIKFDRHLHHQHLYNQNCHQHQPSWWWLYPGQAVWSETRGTTEGRLPLSSIWYTCQNILNTDILAKIFIHLVHLPTYSSLQPKYS